MGCDPREVLLATARSLEAVQAVETWRQAPYGSRPQSICVLMGRRARVRVGYVNTISAANRDSRGADRVCARFRRERADFEPPTPGQPKPRHAILPSE